MSVAKRNVQSSFIHSSGTILMSLARLSFRRLVLRVQTVLVRSFWLGFTFLLAGGGGLPLTTSRTIACVVNTRSRESGSSLRSNITTGKKNGNHWELPSYYVPFFDNWVTYYNTLAYNNQWTIFLIDPFTSSAFDDSDRYVKLHF